MSQSSITKGLLFISCLQSVINANHISSGYLGGSIGGTLYYENQTRMTRFSLSNTTYVWESFDRANTDNRITESKVQSSSQYLPYERISLNNYRRLAISTLESLSLTYSYIKDDNPDLNKAIKTYSWFTFSSISKSSTRYTTIENCIMFPNNVFTFVRSSYSYTTSSFPLITCTESTVYYIFSGSCNFNYDWTFKSIKKSTIVYFSSNINL